MPTAGQVRAVFEPLMGRMREAIRNGGEGFRVTYQSFGNRTEACQPTFHGALGDWLEERGEEELAAFHQWYARNADRLGVRFRRDGSGSVLRSALPAEMADAIPEGWGLTVGKVWVGGFNGPDEVIGCLYGMYYWARAQGWRG